MSAVRSAREVGLVACEACGAVYRLAEVAGGHDACRRCHAHVHSRKPRSLQRTWAFLIAAAILYLPANLIPIMKTSTLMEQRADTILSGVMALWRAGSPEIAVIVFVASIVVPLVRRFGISPVLGYLAAGALLGPLAFSRWKVVVVAEVFFRHALEFITGKATETGKAIAATAPTSPFPRLKATCAASPSASSARGLRPARLAALGPQRQTGFTVDSRGRRKRRSSGEASISTPITYSTRRFATTLSVTSRAAMCSRLHCQRPRWGSKASSPSALACPPRSSRTIA